MSSKLLSSPQTLNILQPKRLNSNGTGNGSPGLGTSADHFGLNTFPGKESLLDLAPGSPTKAPSLLQENQSYSNEQGGFSMSGSRVGVKGLPGKKGVVTMAKRNARERNRVKQASSFSLLFSNLTHFSEIG